MEQRVKHKKHRTTRTLFILCGITIPIVQWLIFYVYANFSSIIMAFQDSQGQISLANFQRFITEFQLPTSEIRVALKNTLITFSVMFVAFPFKVLVSFFIYKKIPFAGFYRIIFFPICVVQSLNFLPYTSIFSIITKTMSTLLHK